MKKNAIIREIKDKYNYSTLNKRSSLDKEISQKNIPHKLYKQVRILCLFFIFLTTSAFGAEDVVSRLTRLDGFSSDHSTRLKEIRELSKEFEFQHPFEPSSTPVDILIPTVEKDLEMLKICVSYARCNLMHPIKNIYIVAAPTEKTIACAQELGAIFVDETTVLPIQIKDIFYFPAECNGCDRRGWLFQQFLKLSADEICESEHVLVIDTDTLLVRPQIYLYGERTIFHCSEEYHMPYRNVYQKLIGESAKGPFSFVSHTTLFEKSKLKHFKRHIEERHQRPWFQAIMDLMDKDEGSAHAENESYPQFVISRYPNSFIQLYFFNEGFNRKKYLPLLLDGQLELNPYIKTISFHSYM